ncbi:MAG TPA: isoprenylcysteine carboxylmethyltransferase family protein [Polyangia bacterium]|jgi:protein-S-isoprenylcysteine O-methyltransferase Ste14|nr:isoprenylcysteine carboxylmethyltransferase family protein [Polyangia bacterium]
MSPWLFFAPWMLFGAWWLARAFGTARTEARESHRQRLTHALLLGAGTLVLVVTPEPLRRRLWHPSLPLVYVALALEVAGVGFAIWAREHLGRLWSGMVTLKESHRIVRSGPYRFVRHPIYTGILVALVGAIVARGDVAGLVAFALFAVGIARKIAIEESLLTGRFGADYADYRRNVAAIIPFIL